MYVIGTAGHVDHGKSALVRALTGIDPDRLEEEKRRGLTIDLGFAWLSLPDGREIGIVDVPGHERFIRNMLAGVGAINVVLFVVAANEGWKPQSQEHLDILDVLGVTSAIVVITKADLVDENRLRAVTNDVAGRIAETSLRAAPVVAVSAQTGSGLEELLAAIALVLLTSEPAEDRGRPRLWIDRVFTMSGAGTVVTGTLVDGFLESQKEVEILPGGVRARIRTIQSHRKQVERIGPGNRTALNLSGLGTHDVVRGNVLTLPGLWRPTTRIGALLEFLPHLSHEPTERGAFKFYVGSAEIASKVKFLKQQPGRGITAVIDLDEAVVVDFGDRFVLRDSGRRETLGGGVILEPHLDPRRRVDEELATRMWKRRERSRAEYLAILLAEEGAIPQSEILPRAGLTPKEARSGGDAVWTATYAIHRRKFMTVSSQLFGVVNKYQSSHPVDPGMPLTDARSALGVDHRLFDEILRELHSRNSIVADREFIRTPDFVPATSGPDTEKLLRLLDDAGANPPTLQELRSEFDHGLIRALIRSGEIVAVSAELVFTSNWLVQLKDSVRELVTSGGPFTVATFRDAVGTTRKYAIPLLEYLDRTGFTRRAGDSRTLGPQS